MARGEMVRFLAENQVTDLERIKEFHGLGLAYAEAFSVKIKWFFFAGPLDRGRFCCYSINRTNRILKVCPGRLFVRKP